MIAHIQQRIKEIQASMLVDGVILTPPQADLYTVRGLRSVGNEIINIMPYPESGTLEEMAKSAKLEANYFGWNMSRALVQLSETCFMVFSKEDQRRWWVFVDVASEAAK